MSITLISNTGLQFFTFETKIDFSLQKEIKFIESSAFDILLLDMFQEYLDVSRVEAHIKTYYKTFAQKLAFKLIHL